MATWQLVQVTCKAVVFVAKVYGKRQVGKGACRLHCMHNGCPEDKPVVYMIVQYVPLLVRGNQWPYRIDLGPTKDLIKEKKQ